MGISVAHRYGPCSPLGQEKSDVISAQILLHDEKRVKSINSLGPSKYVTDAQGKETHQLPIPSKHPGGGNYVVNVGLGTPIRNFYLTLDTGSDITWIRCKPCSSCLGGPKTTIFDPKSSSTFRKNSSDYGKPIEYFDGTYAEGYWASDSLTISSSDSIENFNFVCVNDTNTLDVGLLAFGHGDGNSLVTRNSNVFCHCLPSEDATGYLLFGPGAREKCQVSNFTPLVSIPPDGTYLVNFVGISVGNQTLKITSPSTRTMIDSGTVITRLPDTVYEQFSSAFSKQMDEYGLTRANGDETLHTCYERKGYKCDTVKIPAVVLHFENLDVKLDGSQVLWKNSSVCCLAFAGNKADGDMVIIGNHQLQKLNVLYDIQKRMVGIGPGNCGP
ncbi:hypothetical protein SLEP1_g1821 [Rubroshorea leprosula]|uniref:Peptidase A1 domain-containing protein n=1 Tax=Rubroshorea leprosula TaxID=152421 RepID=A0AAV5HNC4_9ROSI|nr:hypothetical protein SLEP1_g1821 [Rubroshorea leprosula]